MHYEIATLPGDKAQGGKLPRAILRFIVRAVSDRDEPAGLDGFYELCVTLIVDARLGARARDKALRLEEGVKIGFEPGFGSPYQADALVLKLPKSSSLNPRYERRTLRITTNQPFGEWDKIFPDQPVTLANIDRPSTTPRSSK